MDSKVKIELEPFAALEILSYLRSEINENLEPNQNLTALIESVDSYQAQLEKNLTKGQVEEAEHVRKVNQLLNKMP